MEDLIKKYIQEQKRIGNKVDEEQLYDFMYFVQDEEIKAIANSIYKMTQQKIKQEQCDHLWAFNPNVKNQKGWITQCVNCGKIRTI